MKTRATLALAAIAGLAGMAQAQELISVTYSFIETNAGTTTPSTLGGGLAGNGVVNTGEGARIRVDVNYRINGTTGIGQTTTYNPPPPPGVGTALGFGSFYVDLIGSGGDATGAWTARQTQAGFNFGAQQGTILAGGATIQGVGAGQTITPGYTHPAPDTYIGAVPNPLNPVQAARGVWTPASYAARTINWRAAAGSNVPAGQAIAVLLGYETLTETLYDGGPAEGGIDLNPNGTTFTRYSAFVAKYPTIDFGQGINIPIAPAPSSLALLGLGGLIAGRRRR